MDILRAQEHNKELHEQFNYQVCCDVVVHKHFLFHYIDNWWSESLPNINSFYLEKTSKDDKWIVRLCAWS